MARTITIQNIRYEERIKSERIKPATVLKIEADYHREKLHRDRKKLLREHRNSDCGLPREGRFYIDPDIERLDRNDPHNFYHKDRY
jgi:hypothetical protein